MRRNEKWVRRFAITAGLVGVLVAVWFLADPFGGGLTAIDENGVEVRAGVIDGRAGAQARTNKPAPNFLLPDYDKKAVRLDQFEGKVVFVDVTADWCLTCQVNKKLVLDTDEMRARLQSDAVVAMRGDWTLPSEEISRYLESFGRYGIPFDAVYGPGLPDGLALPELLTTDAVRKAMARAAGG